MGTFHFACLLSKALGIWAFGLDPESEASSGSSFFFKLKSWRERPILTILLGHDHGSTNLQRAAQFQVIGSVLLLLLFVNL